jgi:hypothetical protein
MHSHPAIAQQASDRAAAVRFLDAFLAPERMIEYDQHVREFRQRAQDRRKAGFVRCRCVCRHDGHPPPRFRRRQVVNSQVQDSPLVGHRPFHRHRDFLAGRRDLQGYGRFDAVMVGERNHGAQAQARDLLLFETER